MIYSNHAERRMQQRAIPEIAIALLDIYGCSGRADGASIRYFDKRARQRVARAVQALANDLDRLVDMYFVESEEGVVITAGHRTRPIKRDYMPGARRAKRCA